ncbi:MAG: 2-phospho-L-lactate transferase [Methanomicrobiales archaeon]
MIAFLSGGTGTPKLLQGMRELVYDREIGVVVNTADDIRVSGNHISPDIDTVLYLFAGLLNTDTWWGMRGDTFATHRFLRELGHQEVMAIGDRDRAVHIARAEMLREGAGLTAATRALCERFSVEAAILPMTDSEVISVVETGEGPVHYQEYWVRHRGELAITGVRREWTGDRVTTPEVRDLLEGCEAVVIGPSNPVTSIAPILECEGIREILRDRFVVAISPFIGDAPVSGPAAALMRAVGEEPTSLGTARLYGDLVDLFIQDDRDRVEVPGAVRLDTLMTTPRRSEALAWEIRALIREAT